jgi:hypothetical protein
MKKRINYRRIWVAYNGKIPKDIDGRSFDIHHLDGNSDNNSIGNLIAISAYEHYCIHRDKGEFGAAAMIARRMKTKPSDLSETVKLQMKKLIESGQHNFSVKGFIIVRDKDGNNMRVSKNDDRLKTGELVGVNTGFVTVKDKDGNSMRVSKDDLRFISGELKSINCGKIGYNLGRTWTQTNKRPTVKCPHCAKEGDISPMKQHHFDNCKYKIGIV